MNDNWRQEGIEQTIRGILISGLGVSPTALAQSDSHTPLLGRGIGLDSVEAPALVVGVDQFLLIQESRDHLVLQLALPERPDQHVLSEIRTQYVQFLRESVRLDIEIVPSIRERTTKVGSFVSRLAELQSTASVAEVE